MRWIGICERAFELMCKRAVEREVAPGKPLATQQIVQAWIAESRAEIDAARLHGAERAPSRWTGTDAAARRTRSRRSSSTWPACCSGCVDRALQVHGGLGMTDDTPLAFWYREERAARIYDGPDEVHKISVAKRILRRYGMKRPG